MDEMGTLWRKAREFGKVSLFTFDDGTYHCTVIFSTIAGVVLEAKSGTGNKEPEDALKKAIAKCHEILDSMAQQVTSLKRLK